ncbi:AGR027Cp [Eremothecium gossypii ATCC 10895]|uniref:AGR027Cp n=1 Tax=Eremothecium gossypii (strain ATCC 10895 / CBS 109.51 / FGSC 9923 / NRRL Y-1056) TaxID=284811 RepID=Q750C8_EREGS|nr:AGR027Cp [Eremothecium gossypii ATCC 10895]AAS54516.1 AGR027Cp [Eremothecium gossypii ATCC 10895]
MSKRHTGEQSSPTEPVPGTGALTGPLEMLQAGSTVLVGVHQVEVIEYLAEGGFAHIYKVSFVGYTNELDRQDRILQPGDTVCLKRVRVSDENGLNELRNEVEVMKKLRNCSNIVQYYDSNASRLGDGKPGYEVLLLMELCPNGSLLDYMNQRLATKLSEAEVLKIMYDITVGLSHMHYQRTPLIHRDIKIENVLVDADNNFKLCDFGSTSPCLPAVASHQEIAMLMNNIYVHTTPQYRSPEMIDLYRCLPINEKSDIWALGIFLYKLLFYTTPFELTGQFAILHSKYEIPRNSFSSKLINLVIIMLAENPYLRPNVYQVMYHICSMMECEVKIDDLYGQGPYNFDMYGRYQEKLQRLQYDMLMSHQLAQRGIINTDKVNDLFISTFECAPKQPMVMGQNAVAQQQIFVAPPSTNTSMPVDMQQSLPKPLDHNGPNAHGGLDSLQKLPKSADVGNYPVAETHMHMYADAQKNYIQVPRKEVMMQHTDRSVLSDHSGNGTSTPSLPGSCPVQHEQLANTPKSKQYKKNNPFPKMAKQDFVHDTYDESDEHSPGDDPAPASKPVDSMIPSVPATVTPMVSVQRDRSFQHIQPGQIPENVRECEPESEVEMDLSHKIQNCNLDQQQSLQAQDLKLQQILLHQQQLQHRQYQQQNDNRQQHAQRLHDQMPHQQRQQLPLQMHLRPQHPCSNNVPLHKTLAEQAYQLSDSTQPQPQPQYQAYYVDRKTAVPFQTYSNAYTQNQHVFPQQSSRGTYGTSDRIQNGSNQLIEFSSPDKSANDAQLDLTYNQINLSKPNSVGGGDPSENASVELNGSGSSVLTNESIAMELPNAEERPVPPSTSGATQPAENIHSRQESDSYHDREDSRHVTGHVPRRSLELDFQEIDLSSSPTPVSASKTSSKAHLQPNRSGTANCGTSNSSSVVSGVRKSFHRGRKSVDLDVSKKESKEEPTNSGSGKRRSIFGVFKS